MKLNELTAVHLPADQAKTKYEVYGDYNDNVDHIVVLVDSEDTPYGYMESLDDGSYHVIAERSELSTKSLDEAKQWLYDNWIQYVF